MPLVAVSGRAIDLTTTPERREIPMKTLSVLTAAAALAIATGSAFAAPLNLVSVNPDVASGFVAIDYNATTNTFTASGQTQNLGLPPSFALNLREFSITATIDNSGNLIGAGTLMVRGDYGGVDQVLFSSTSIIAFGFSSFNKFEFLFSQTAGSLAPVGTPIGTILTDANLNFPGNVPSFQSSFSNRFFPGGPGNGNADTFVPAPSSLALIASIGGLAARRRRR